MLAKVHDDEDGEFFALSLLFFVLLFEVLVLLYFVIKNVPHDSIEGFLAAVGFYLFDGCVQDRILYFFREAIAK